MKLYAVVLGCYDDTYVAGVYSSPERAMAAHPVPADYPYPVVPSPADASRRGGWQQGADGQWSNGLDWSASAVIEEFWLDDEEPKAAEVATDATG